MSHLIAFDDKLAQDFKDSPADHLKIFESAVKIVYRNEIFEQQNPDMEESPKF